MKTSDKAVGDAFLRLLLAAMMYLIVLLLNFVPGLWVTAFAEVPPIKSDYSPSELRRLTGVKFPNDSSEGAGPVRVEAYAAPQPEKLRGFVELLPYVLRSPDQEEAGSCLYMSLTGIAEWWLARLHPEVSRAPDGPIDLSERYMMNFSKGGSWSGSIANWKTDSVYLYNLAKAIPRNTDYRFTKGWYKNDDDLIPAKPREIGAEFDAKYNWIDERASIPRASFVALPTFRRRVIYADPESDQWNTGVMPANIVDRIKKALVSNKAPIQVIYNHFGYWHSTVIVGFDDKADNHKCEFVRDFLKFMKDRSHGDERAKDTYEKTLRAFKGGGGCHRKGVFYVRDSIYEDRKGPVYTYTFNSDEPGARAPYSQAIVLLEYDWVRYMSNHVIQILAE